MEEWREIPGFENYQVSNLGRIRNKNLQIIKAYITSKGYLAFTACKDGKQKNLKIHRAVGLAFLPNLENFPTIDHINRIKTDNRVCNLRWASYSTQNFNQVRSNRLGEKYIRLQQDKYFVCYADKNKIRCFSSLEEAIRFRDTVLAQNTNGES